MPNLTSVTVTAGVPTTGTGTVSTIDALMALIGEVQASPTSNTALDRLKAILTQLATTGVHIDPTQLSGLQTAAAAMSANYQLVALPSDQVKIPTHGNTAHDAVDADSPQKIGGRAVAGMSGLTLVAAADRTDALFGIDGAQYVRPHCGHEDIISGVAAITDGSSTSVIASAGAGVKNYITTAIIANTSATAVTVDLRDGAAGTVKATLPVPANTSGVVCNLPVPLPFSAATAVCADPSAAASTVTVTLIGYKSKV